MDKWAQRGSYHYYPALPQVHRWLEQAQFVVVQTAQGDGYYHMLTVEARGYHITFQPCHYHYVCRLLETNCRW